MTVTAHRIEPDSSGTFRAPNRDALEREIYEAVSATDWTELKGWKAFADIADSVEPDSMMVYAEASSPDGDRFSVPADISVILHYVASDDHAEAADYPDSFPASLAMKRTANGSLQLVDIIVTLEQQRD